MTFRDTHAAVQDVLAERLRQVDGEGWTPEHDDQHRDCELAAAASSYAIAAVSPRAFGENNPPALWPWVKEWCPFCLPTRMRSASLRPMSTTGSGTSWS